MSFSEFVRSKVIAARLMDALSAMNIKYNLFEDTEATLITVPFDQFRAEFDKNLKKEGKDFSDFLDALLKSIAIRAGFNIHSYLLKEENGWTFEIPR
jgi:hypothetical protein